MNTALWVGQALLAAVFLGSGILKSTQTKERMLATGQSGVASYPLAFIRFIAACEILGAIGLVVPWATGIAPVLTPLAAIGLAVIMLGAARAHAQLREPRNVVTNVVLFSIAVFVAWSRWSELALG